MFSKQHLAALTAEFIGTVTLALVVLAMVNSQLPFVYFVAVGAGLVLAIMVLAIGRISGAHINPAVTFGLWTIKEVSTVRGIAYIVAQMLGGLGALAIYSYLIGQESITFQENDFSSQVLVAEVVGTAIFTFGIAAAVAGKLTDGAKAFAIGASLTVGILIASIASSAFLNPAVMVAAQSLSIADAAGAIIGGVIGFNVYVLMFSASQPAVKKTSSTPVAAQTAAAAKPMSQKAPAKKPASTAKKAKKSSSKK